MNHLLQALSITTSDVANMKYYNNLLTQPLCTSSNHLAIDLDRLRLWLLHNKWIPHVKKRMQMNGRERFISQVKPCSSMADLVLVVAGGIRLEIVKSLLEASKSVSALADDLELDITLVSHNLRLLRENGLVKAARLGRNRFYHLTDELIRCSLDGQDLQIEINCQRREKIVFHLVLNKENN